MGLVRQRGEKRLRTLKNAPSESGVRSCAGAVRHGPAAENAERAPKQRPRERITVAFDPEGREMESGAMGTCWKRWRSTPNSREG